MTYLWRTYHIPTTYLLHTYVPTTAKTRHQLTWKWLVLMPRSTSWNVNFSDMPFRRENINVVEISPNKWLLKNSTFTLENSHTNIRKFIAHYHRENACLFHSWQKALTNTTIFPTYFAPIKYYRSGSQKSWSIVTKKQFILVLLIAILSQKHFL